MAETYKLDSLKLKSRVFLAPMAEINDIAFRILCKKAGAELCYTGMLNPQSQNPIALKDKPAIQIFCKTEKGVKEFIKKYDKQAVLWDFNLGCPAKLARQHGYGAYMSNELTAIEKIIKVMNKATKKPINIKLRKTDNTEKILKIAEKYCSAVCIHPRTAKQGYSGEPDLKYAEHIKQISKLPVIYSGNVNESNIKDLLEKFDAVMIGREAVGDPNIFSRVNGKGNIIKNPFKEYLKLAKQYKLKYSQIKLQAMNFTKKHPGAKKIRGALVGAKSVKDIKKLMKGL